MSIDLTNDPIKQNKKSFFAKKCEKVDYIKKLTQKHEKRVVN